MNSDQWTWTINTRRCQRWIVFPEPVCCIHLSSVNSAKLVKRFWRKSSCDKKESNYVQTRQRMMQINKQHGQGDARRESCTIIQVSWAIKTNTDTYGFLVGRQSGTLDAMQQLTFQRSVGTDHWKKRMNISVFEPRQGFRENAKLRKGSLSYYTENFESTRNKIAV